jgi:hypothetical protein
MLVHQRVFNKGMTELRFALPNMAGLRYAAFLLKLVGALSFTLW